MPNRPLEPLRTLLEARSLLGALICTFLAPFGTPKGPQNRSKIDHCLDMFLDDFWEPLFHASGLHLGSQNDPKWNPKGTQDQNTKIIDFDAITIREPHWGVLKIVICGAFLGPFLRYLFETSFPSIVDPLGDPFGTLWASKKHPKKHLKKRHQKRP